MKNLFLIILFLSLSYNLYAHSDDSSKPIISSFSMKTYTDECGGKIYPNCEDQDRIFYDGLKHAKSMNTHIILIFGADWCPYCNNLYTSLHDDENAFQEFKKKYTVIELNAEKPGSEKIAKKYDVVVNGVPTVIIIDPAEEKYLYELNIYESFTLQDLEQTLDVGIAQLQPKSSEQTISSTKYLGAASIQLTNKPIEVELKDNKIKWISDHNTLFQDLVNQGMAYLHVFHYIDALRSFKTAHEINKKSLYPIIGMVLSYAQLSTEDSLQIITEFIENFSELRKSSSKREKIWLVFAQAYFMSQYPNSPFIKESVSDLTESFELLLELNPDDLEVLTIGAYLSNAKNSSKLFKKALSIDPLHIGANHYLVYMYESLGQAAKALPYAKVISEQASYNAHAVHMYGHVLPDNGEWEKANDLFLQAHQIHLDWAQKNAVHPSEDWHYPHNLNLLAITQVALGQKEAAEESFATACEHDKRACIKGVIFEAINLPSEDALRNLDIITDRDPNLMNHLGDYYFAERVLNSKSFYKEIKSHLSSFDNIPVANLTLDMVNWEQDSSSFKFTKKILLIRKIKKTLRKGFPQTGFDSWSTGLLNALYTLKIVRSFNDSELEDAVLKVLEEFSVDTEKKIIESKP